MIINDSKKISIYNYYRLLKWIYLFILFIYWQMIIGKELLIKLFLNKTNNYKNN